MVGDGFIFVERDFPTSEKKLFRSLHCFWHSESSKSLFFCWDLFFIAIIPLSRMGRDSCGHLFRKSLHSQCRYTRQCSNWCWDRQMPEIRMTFVTIITFNQLQSKPLVCMTSPLPPSWAVSQRNFLTFQATPGRVSGSTSACLWPWSEGTLLAYWSVCKFDLILATLSALTSVPARHLPLFNE